MDEKNVDAGRLLDNCDGKSESVTGSTVTRHTQAVNTDFCCGIFILGLSICMCLAYIFYLFDGNGYREWTYNIIITLRLSNDILLLCVFIMFAINSSNKQWLIFISKLFKVDMLHIILLTCLIFCIGYSVYEIPSEPNDDIFNWIYVVLFGLDGFVIYFIGSSLPIYCDHYNKLKDSLLVKSSQLFIICL